MRRRLLAVAAVGLATIALAAAAAFASGRGAPLPPPGRQTVPAPIDDVQVLIRESNPPQVTLRVTAGLPSGCAQPDSDSLGRDGDTFIVTVLNSVPTGNPVCTMIYGTYVLTIDLGPDIQAGRTYTVRVNDRTITFRT